jgi:hypothetical protein
VVKKPRYLLNQTALDQYIVETAIRKTALEDIEV